MGSEMCIRDRPVADTVEDKPRPRAGHLPSSCLNDCPLSQSKGHSSQRRGGVDSCSGSNNFGELDAL